MSKNSFRETIRNVNSRQRIKGKNFHSLLIIRQRKVIFFYQILRKNKPKTLERSKSATNHVLRFHSQTLLINKISQLTYTLQRFNFICKHKNL